MSIEVEVGGVYEKAADLTPTGTVSAFAGDTAPEGWLLCDGSAVSMTTYSDLFDVIGRTYGEGDGSTTFELPDLQGIFIRGAGLNVSMKKADNNAFDGGNLGDKKNDKMQQITGSFGRPLVAGSSVSGAFSKSSNYGGDVDYGGNGYQYDYYFDSDKSTAQGGARTGDETAPASLSMNYIIKT